MGTLNSTWSTGNDLGYVGASNDPPSVGDRLPTKAMLRPDARGRLNPMTTARRGGAPRIVSLIAGTEDETLAQVSCTIAADTTNFKIPSRGWQMTMSGAVTAYAVMSPVSPATSGILTFPAAQAVCMWVYLPDASKVTSCGVELSLNSGNTVTWINSSATAPAITLVNGWNLIRMKTPNGLGATQLANWGNLNRVRAFVITNAATTATLGHVWLECPEKARLCFILDRGYKSFVSSGALNRLRAAKVPVTWALDITLLGTNVGNATEVVSEADIASYAALGDSISMHSWDGQPTSAYTAAQIRTDTAKCLKWLQARGYGGRMFRAAWVQDLATNASAASGMVLTQAQSSVPQTRLGTWPPIAPHNMERWYFYTRSTTEVDDYFALWRATNGLSLTYNHGINAAGGNDATPAEFDYWMSKVEQALTDGWLEAVTLEQLWYETGGDYVTTDGATVARYTASDGTAAAKTVL